MILIDTSVLVDFLRTKDQSLFAKFRSLPVAVCGITRAEILHGAKSPKDESRLSVFLNAFVPIRIPEWQWDTLGVFLAELRSHGITVPFRDAAIASLAVSYDIPLWTRDEQFRLMQSVEPSLQLFAD